MGEPIPDVEVLIDGLRALGVTCGDRPVSEWPGAIQNELRTRADALDQARAEINRLKEERGRLLAQLVVARRFIGQWIWKKAGIVVQSIEFQPVEITFRAKV
jgi:hypothetical protein